MTNQIYKPFAYQQYATAKIINLEGAGLLMEMGLGKTVSTLTAIAELLRAGQVNRVLVIAPKKVAQSVWPQEVLKWEHLKHLTTSLILGSEKQRKQALLTKADIYIINRDNVAWLTAQYGSKFPFDMVVVDESSSFKNPRSIRFRALRKVLPRIKRRVILTGTPTPHSYLDLWAQVYLLDSGQRLGQKYTAFRDEFFKVGKKNGEIVYSYDLVRPSGTEADLLGLDINEKVIFDKVADICFSMKTRDYLDLPPRLDRDVSIRLSPDIERQYQEFKRERVLELAESGQEITAVNAAAVSIKLLQFANGAVYLNGRDYVEIHNEKLEMLGELIESATSPVLVFYAYQHDVDRINRYLKSLRPTMLRGDSEVQDWNRGKIGFLLANAASAGHGLNLQYGGHNVIWFGAPVPRSSELYQQGVARVDRQGQKNTVVNQRLVVANSMDVEAFAGIDRKASDQDIFMRAIKAEVETLKK